MKNQTLSPYETQSELPGQKLRFLLAGPEARGLQNDQVAVSASGLVETLLWTNGIPRRKVMEMSFPRFR